MNQKLQLELLWWIFTAVVLFGVLAPIYSEIEGYPFYRINTIYIVVFITVTRYIFLLSYTFLAKLQLVKLALIFLCIPFVFYLGQELNYFQTFLDEEGQKAVVGSLALAASDSMVKYVRNEMLLFGVGSIVSVVIFPFRLIVSIWRFRNRGTV